MSEDLHRKGGACVNDEEIIKLFEARDRHHADAFPCAYLEYVNKRLPRQVAEMPEEAPPEQTGTEQATVPEQAAPSALLAARRKRRG